MAFRFDISQKGKGIQIVGDTTNSVLEVGDKFTVVVPVKMDFSNFDDPHFTGTINIEFSYR